MSLPRIVVDNSAVLPMYLAEEPSDHYDAGLVTNRAISLYRTIRMRRVNAYVPPSFFREFLNAAISRVEKVAPRSGRARDRVREMWDDLLTLGLMPVPLKDILHRAGSLTFDDLCPQNDSWYVAAAIQAQATFWMSHEHTDGLFNVASKHVKVRLLSKEAAAY